MLLSPDNIVEPVKKTDKWVLTVAIYMGKFREIKIGVPSNRESWIPFPSPPAQECHCHVIQDPPLAQIALIFMQFLWKII